MCLLRHTEKGPTALEADNLAYCQGERSGRETSYGWFFFIILFACFDQALFSEKEGRTKDVALQGDKHFCTLWNKVEAP